MPRAIAREKRKQAVETEDAITVRLLELASWAERHSRFVVVSVVMIAATGAGFWYFRNYQESVRQQAAVELEQLRVAAAAGAEQEAVSSLDEFILRFGGTEYGDEGRLLLGRLLMDEGAWQRAIETLQPAAERPVDTPLGAGAAMLLAAAQEGAGDRAAAVRTLTRVAAGARYDYQRHRAFEEQARLLIDAGDYDGAVATYEQLLATLAEEDAGRIQGRLAEARALAAAAAAGHAPANLSLGPPPSGAPTSTEEGAPVTEPAPGADEASRSGSDDSGPAAATQRP